jgi:hypothetical protein
MASARIFPSRAMASLRNLDDPVIVRLLEHAPNFYLRNFPEASIISTGMP